MNFIEVDNFIKVFMSKRVKQYNESLEKVKLLSSVDTSKLGGRLQRAIESDIKIINDLSFYENIFMLYKTNTDHLIRDLLKILKAPLRKNDTKAQKNADREKNRLINQYIETVITFIPYDLFEHITLSDAENTSVNGNICENCGNSSLFMKESDIIICKVCFNEVIRLVFNNCSYSMVGGKCHYDRLTHFKECIKQYQCKQNTFINPEVYSKIDKALITSGIIDDNVKEKSKRYKKVTKSHISYFLKELGFSKYYDDYNLIYCTMTGTKPKDISHLENKLYEDFTKISEAYSVIMNDNERKNFINIQFILYKLLLRHKEKISIEDFGAVKSQDKKMDREKLCKEIFVHLGWEYI